MKPLANKSAIITGASLGLGRAIAEAYVDAGCSVFLCGRDAGTLQTALNELAAKAGSDQVVAGRAADVSQREEVDRLLAGAIDSLSGRIDILVNNAGVYGPFGAIQDVDWDEWVQAININLMGTVYACRAVIPHMTSKNKGKIINMSGGGATSPLPSISAYAASKAGVVRFTETLALELAKHNIDVNAVAPGALATRLLDQVIQAGPGAVGEDFHQRMLKIKKEGGTPLGKGASLCVWLGSDESDGISGRLLSAVWDPWKDLGSHADKLKGSDIYTLRRIIPEDRGETW